MYLLYSYLLPNLIIRHLFQNVTCHIPTHFPQLYYLLLTKIHGQWSIDYQINVPSKSMGNRIIHGKYVVSIGIKIIKSIEYNVSY